ncbi:MAG: hypothetical protein M3083_00420, partial [Actinomycetota bacterium]|nr:hypothetical protein [Actinomycetota bacterium]
MTEHRPDRPGPRDSSVPAHDAAAALSVAANVAALSVAANVAAVRGRIEAAGGDPDRITVVAVTKGFGLDAARAAV